jgi:hypothetical protein
MCPSMVILMEGPPLVVVRVVANMLANVANDTMSDCAM